MVDSRWDSDIRRERERESAHERSANKAGCSLLTSDTRRADFQDKQTINSRIKKQKIRKKTAKPLDLNQTTQTLQDTATARLRSSVEA